MSESELSGLLKGLRQKLSGVHHLTDDRHNYYNPDGPEAAAAIEFLLSALSTLRARVAEVEREKADWIQAHTTLTAQYREKQTFVRELQARAEAATAIRSLTEKQNGA